MKALAIAVATTKEVIKLFLARISSESMTGFRSDVYVTKAKILTHSMPIIK